MKGEVPRSLVQIHYHDRIGGVRRTIETYARTFAAIAGEDALNLLLCTAGSAKPIGWCKTIALPGMDYHTFRTRQAYHARIEQLFSTLQKQIAAPGVRLPVAVVAHNLNLGKNPALAAAFFRCARKFGSADGNYRFFLVMHDFAEAGRCRLMASIRGLAEMEPTAIRELYGTGSPVHYVVPDRFSARVTGLGPAWLSVLPHPVDDRVVAAQPAAAKAAIRRNLRRLAAGDGVTADLRGPLFCYPSRMIYRKNALEALLIATVLREGSLIIGACGRSAADRMRFSALLRIAREFDLPVVTNPARTSGDAHRDPFVPLYGATDAVISTSVAEGYGYSLIEPWALGIPVIGRYPVGILLPKELAAGLYCRLPVPASWISRDRMFEFFRSSRTAAFGTIRTARRLFDTQFILDDTVDFGMLDTAEQAALIRRLLRCGRDRDQLRSLLEKKGAGWPGAGCLDAVSAETVRKNRQTARRRNNGAFEKSFVNILRTVPRHSPVRWHSNLTKFYRDGRHFTVLEPPPRT